MSAEGRFVRLVRAALLLGTAALIGKLLVSGQLALYMSPAMHPLTALAGAAVAALGLAELWRARAKPTGRSHGTVDQLLTAAVVALPLVAGLALAPKALDSSALGGGDAARLALAWGGRGGPVAGAMPAPPTEPVDDFPALLRYLRQAGEGGVGQPVRALGIVARSPSLAANEFVLLRYAMVHCVADAQPVALVVTAPADGGWATDQWVEIDGTLGALEHDGERLVSIAAARITPADEPSEPYLAPVP
jgi:putative membrane protein